MMSGASAGLMQRVMAEPDYDNGLGLSPMLSTTSGQEFRRGL
jgi:hypothetical protein